MFFSDRNENTVYINHFSGLLEVEGTGDLEAGDAVVTPKSRDSWADEYDTLSIKLNFPGVFSKHPNFSKKLLLF